MQSQPALHSRLLAEFIGTMTLCAVGIGAILMNGDLLGVAFAHGLAIATMVTAIGHISGGHLNPAVTTAMMAFRKISPKDGVLYIVAQLLGGVAGAGLMKWLVDGTTGAAPFDTAARVGLAKGLSGFNGMLLEAIATLLLVWVVYGVAVDPDGAFAKVAGLPIGFVVTMDILMIGPMTGATMNPARWFGPNVLLGEWANAWVWIVGPVLGAVVAGALYLYGIRPRVASES